MASTSDGNKIMYKRPAINSWTDLVPCLKDLENTIQENREGPMKQSAEGPELTQEKNEGTVKIDVKYMKFFGQYPENKNLVLVRCKLCGYLIKLPGLKSHIEERHSPGENSERFKSLIKLQKEIILSKKTGKEKITNHNRVNQNSVHQNSQNSKQNSTCSLKPDPDTEVVSGPGHGKKQKAEEMKCCVKTPRMKKMCPLSLFKCRKHSEEQKRNVNRCESYDELKSKYYMLTHMKCSRDESAFDNKRNHKSISICNHNEIITNGIIPTNLQPEKKHLESINCINMESTESRLHGFGLAEDSETVGQKRRQTQQNLNNRKRHRNKKWPKQGLTSQQVCSLESLNDRNARKCFVRLERMDLTILKGHQVHLDSNSDNSSVKETVTFLENPCKQTMNAGAEYVIHNTSIQAGNVPPELSSLKNDLEDSSRKLSPKGLNTEGKEQGVENLTKMQPTLGYGSSDDSHWPKRVNLLQKEFCKYREDLGFLEDDEKKQPTENTYKQIIDIENQEKSDIPPISHKEVEEVICKLKELDLSESEGSLLKNKLDVQSHKTEVEKSIPIRKYNFLLNESAGKSSKKATDHASSFMQSDPTIAKSSREQKEFLDDHVEKEKQATERQEDASVPRSTYKEMTQFSLSGKDISNSPSQNLVLERKKSLLVQNESLEDHDEKEKQVTERREDASVSRSSDEEIKLFLDDISNAPSKKNSDTLSVECFHYPHLEFQECSPGHGRQEKHLRSAVLQGKPSGLSNQVQKTFNIELGFTPKPFEIKNDLLNEHLGDDGACLSMIQNMKTQTSSTCSGTGPTDSLKSAMIDPSKSPLNMGCTFNTLQGSNSCSSDLKSPIPKALLKELSQILQSFCSKLETPSVFSLKSHDTPRVDKGHNSPLIFDVDNQFNEAVMCSIIRGTETEIPSLNDESERFRNALHIAIEEEKARIQAREQYCETALKDVSEERVSLPPACESYVSNNFENFMQAMSKKYSSQNNISEKKGTSSYITPSHHPVSTEKTDSSTVQNVVCLEPPTSDSGVNSYMKVAHSKKKPNLNPDPKDTVTVEKRAILDNKRQISNFEALDNYNSVQNTRDVLGATHNKSYSQAQDTDIVHETHLEEQPSNSLQSSDMQPLHLFEDVPYKLQSNSNPESDAIRISEQQNLERQNRNRSNPQGTGVVDQTSLKTQPSYLLQSSNIMNQLISSADKKQLRSIADPKYTQEIGCFSKRSTSSNFSPDHEITAIVEQLISEVQNTYGVFDSACISFPQGQHKSSPSPEGTVSEVEIDASPVSDETIDWGETSSSPNSNTSSSPDSSPDLKDAVTEKRKLNEELSNEQRTDSGFFTQSSEPMDQDELTLSPSSNYPLDHTQNGILSNDITKQNNGVASIFKNGSLHENRIDNGKEASKQIFLGKSRNGMELHVQDDYLAILKHSDKNSATSEQNKNGRQSLNMGVVYRGIIRSQDTSLECNAYMSAQFELRKLSLSVAYQESLSVKT